MKVRYKYIVVRGFTRIEYANRVLYAFVTYLRVRPGRGGRGLVNGRECCSGTRAPAVPPLGISFGFGLFFLPLGARPFALVAAVLFDSACSQGEV